MAKLITAFATQELEEKIAAIKAEREKTADALKRYEDELERRKQEMPLGVPAVGKFCLTYDGCVDKFINNRQELEDYHFNVFTSEESAEKHAEMLLDWRKDGLVANAKGEQIDIKVLLPLLRKGWVAMDANGKWFWFSEVPELHNLSEIWALGQFKADSYFSLGAFNIKPAEDWTKSLQECGL